MTYDNKWKQVEEGKTSFTIFDDAKRIYDSSVFYNPRMVINRDFTLLMIQTIAEIDQKPLVYVDPLAGTGIRSFRIVNELSSNIIDRIYVSDKNPKAIEIIEKNASNYEYSNKFTIHRAEAFAILSQLIQERNHPDIIDIDPFGSPVEFIDVSLRALRRNQGYFFATATDLQVLCGRYSDACFRIYNAHPTRYHICHEVALRILLYNVLTSAGRLGLAIKPILCLNHEHFLRIKVKIIESKNTANLQHQQQGYVHFCPKCSFYLLRKIKETYESPKCYVCDSELETAGPVWLGSLYDKNYVEQMLKNLRAMDLPSKNQIEKILEIIIEEEDLPFFYFIPYILRHLKKSGVTRQQVIDGLREAGFKASRTVFDPEGLKTDASYYEIVNIVEKY